MKTENVDLKFTDDGIDLLAKLSAEINASVENIGARRLQTVMSRLLNEIMFDVPDKIAADSKILITKELVAERLAGLVKNRDLSQYIL